MICIDIADKALADLDDGFRFYERREHGLGEYFAISLRADIEGLKSTAGIHRQTYRNFHRLLSKNFPWAVFYIITETGVTVVSVTDCRREPRWIRKHLDS